MYQRAADDVGEIDWPLTLQGLFLQKRLDFLHSEREHGEEES